MADDNDKSSDAGSDGGKTGPSGADSSAKDQFTVNEEERSLIAEMRNSGIAPRDVRHRYNRDYAREAEEAQNKGKNDDSASKERGKEIPTMADVEKLAEEKAEAKAAQIEARLRLERDRADQEQQIRATLNSEIDKHPAIANIARKRREVGIDVAERMKALRSSGRLNATSGEEYLRIVAQQAQESIKEELELMGAAGKVAPGDKTMDARLDAMREAGEGAGGASRSAGQGSAQSRSSKFSVGEEMTFGPGVTWPTHAEVMADQAREADKFLKAARRG